MAIRIDHTHGAGSFMLNITSLMDILTIILIYLVMGFSSEEHDVELPQDIALPASNTQRQAEVNLTVSVARSELRVEGVVVAALDSGRIRGAKTGGDDLLPELLAQLKQQRARRLDAPSIRAGDAREDDSDVIYIEADKSIEYETIDRILRTARAAGFARFRLATIRAG